MSAWSVGKEPGGAVRALDGQPQIQTFVDKVIKWIPGDVLAIYVAAVTALGLDNPRLWLTIVAIALAPVLVVLGALSLDQAERPTKISLRAGLALGATAIWTLTVPGTGWLEIDAVANNPKTVAVIAGIVGLVYGLLADVLVRED